jgi:hypothetical protein
MVRTVPVRLLNKWGKQRLRNRANNLQGIQVRTENKIAKEKDGQKKKKLHIENGKLKREISKTLNVLNRRFYKKP